MLIIQHPKITVRIQEVVLALRTYYNNYLGRDKARSASGRPTTRDAQHPKSGVLNSYDICYCKPSGMFFSLAYISFKKRGEMLAH